jgi:hypothetical protein
MRNVIIDARLIALAGMLLGCGTTTDRAVAEHPSVLAISSAVRSPNSIQVRETKVLARHLNLRRPVVLGVERNLVSIMFVERQHSGIVLEIDPTSLETRSTRSFVYPGSLPTAAGSTPAPPSVDLEPGAITLESGKQLVTWKENDQAFVRIHGEGEPQPLSQSGVLGRPSLVSVDGRRIIAVFIAGADDGFELDAVALDAT